MIVIVIDCDCDWIVIVIVIVIMIMIIKVHCITEYRQLQGSPTYLVYVCDLRAVLVLEVSLAQSESQV